MSCCHAVLSAGMSSLFPECRRSISTTEELEISVCNLPSCNSEGYESNNVNGCVAP